MENFLLNLIPARNLEARLAGATTAAAAGGAASASASSAGMSLALSSAATIPSLSTAAMATGEMFLFSAKFRGCR